MPTEPPPDTVERSPTLGTAAELTHPARGGVSGLWWIPADAPLTLRLRRSAIAIPRSFLYVWDGPLGGASEPSAIDQKMAVEEVPPSPELEAGLGYWPRYDQLSPAQRRLYLDWHASGRTVVPSELGYAFLYFYNLERRALVDRRDVRAVASEVGRLRELYARSGQPVSRSWDRYTGSFLGFLVASEPAAFSRDDVPALLPLGERPSPDDLEPVLSWYGQTATPVPADVAYRVAAELPLSQHGVVVRRVAEQLRELFGRKYADRHGAGIVLQPSKRPRRLTYRPASAAVGQQAVAVPSVLAAPKQLEVLSDLWNTCVEELRRPSTVVRRQGHARLTAQAWEALPPELRAEADHPREAEVTGLFNGKLGEEAAVAVVAAADAVRAAGIDVAVAGVKVSPAVARRVAQTVAHCGYGIEPDPRLVGGGWENDQPVVLFRPGGDAAGDDPGRYAAAACMLDVGLALAAADGTIDEEETAELRRHVAATLDLSAGEQVRLDARRHLSAVAGVDLGPATRTLKKLSPRVRDAVGRMSLALIVADGVVTPEELAATRRVYRALDLDPAAVDAEVAALRPTTAAATAGHDGDRDDPVLVLAGRDVEGGEAIPRPPVPAGGLRLDRAAVAAIMRDTQEVAQMLAEAMSAAGATEVVTTDPAEEVSAGGPGGPTEASPAPTVAAPEPSASRDAAVPLDRVPARFRAICEALLTRGEWPIEEATKLAARHNLMLSGALEQLNDWAVEQYGAPAFIEEDGRVLVERGHLT